MIISELLSFHYHSSKRGEI